MNLQSYRQWVLEIAAPWSPKKRYLCTVIVVVGIVILWWVLSFKKLLVSLVTVRKETSQYAQTKHEYETLLSRVKIKDADELAQKYDSSSIFSNLLEIVNGSGLVLEKSIMRKEQDEIIALELSGSFELFQQFLIALSKNQMSISSCELKRMDDRTIHGSLLIDVRAQ